MEILGRSALLAASVTGLCIALSVPLAWLTVRTDLPLKRFWSVVTALPLVIPSYLGAFALIAALSPRGMFQQLLGGVFGIERLPDIHGFWGATLTLTALSFPYVLLPVRAAMRNLDPGVEESARVLGHGPWSVFYRITLMQLRPAIVAGALLVSLYTLSDFGAVSLLQYETFTWAIYLQFNSAFDRGIAASLSLVLVGTALAILLFDSYTRGLARYSSKGVGGKKRTPMVSLGRWKWVGVGFCSLVGLVSIGMPLSVLSYWLVRGLDAGEQISSFWGTAANSVYVSLLAAVVCVLAAVPVAMLSVRYPSRFSSMVERFSYLGFALPGVVVALALVYFGANYALPLYQTLAMLIFAYAILFLPPAVGAIRAQLLQIDPRVEEAARGLGPFTSESLPVGNSPPHQEWGPGGGRAGIPDHHEGASGHPPAGPNWLQDPGNQRLGRLRGCLLRQGRSSCLAACAPILCTDGSACPRGQRTRPDPSTGQKVT